MKQFILIMICILLQVIHAHAGSKDITWKWDYSEAMIFYDCLASGYWIYGNEYAYVLWGEISSKLPEGFTF